MLRSLAPVVRRTASAAVLSTRDFSGRKMCSVSLAHVGRGALPHQCGLGPKAASAWVAQVTARRGVSAAATKTMAYLLTDIGEGTTECEIVRWFVKVGDRVAQFDRICEVHSDKATAEITSRYDGVIAKLHYAEGAMAKVGLPLVDIEMNASDAPQPPPKSQTSQETSAPPSLPSTAPRQVHASPAVRALARTLGVELADVTGTGPNGRVFREDVETFAAHRGGPGMDMGVTSASGERRPLTQVQRSMFRKMTAALSVPHFVYCDEVELDALFELRARIGDSITGFEVGGSLLPLLVKTFSAALEQFPLVNAALETDAAGEPRLLINPDHNIGIAMDTAAGLIVPNIKRVQTLSVPQIASELARLVESAAKAGGRLPAETMRGTSITISNIGSIGGTYMSPVVSPPEVCIVALGRWREQEAVAIDGIHSRQRRNECECDCACCKSRRRQHRHTSWTRRVMPLSFAADHRVLDGATVARFAACWKEYILRPEQLLALPQKRS